MSKTEAAEIPDTVIVSPATDSVHRQGDGIEPACVDRLHHVDHDETEWRLTQEPLTDATNRCGHPECFQNTQLITDGGEEIDVVLRRSDHISMETFVDAIATQAQVPEPVTADARRIADNALERYAGEYSDDEIGAAALYVSALIHDADLSQRRLVGCTEVSQEDIREAYLDLGNNPEVLPHWYADTREPDNDKEEEADADADDSKSMGLIERLKGLLQTDGDDDQ